MKRILSLAACFAAFSFLSAQTTARYIINNSDSTRFHTSAYSKKNYPAVKVNACDTIKQSAKSTYTCLENSKMPAMEAWPASAVNTITITNINDKLNGQTVKVVNVKGKLAHSFKLKSCSILDISHWEAGAYKLTLSNGEIVRILKQTRSKSKKSKT